MWTTGKAAIREAVIKKLLSGLDRIAENGDSIGMIRVSRFLLYLANKFGDVSIDLVAEHQK